MRFVRFNAISPLSGFPPMVPDSREAMLLWDWTIEGTCTVVAAPGARGDLAVQIFMTPLVNPPVVPAGPPAGLMARPATVAGLNYPYWTPNHHGFDGQLVRAHREARARRQAHIPVNPAPGARGFTGFNLFDLREIAKSFGDPSIYTIRP
jgi:hypothetical protein